MSESRSDCNAIFRLIRCRLLGLADGHSTLNGFANQFGGPWRSAHQRCAGALRQLVFYDKRPPYRRMPSRHHANSELGPPGSPKGGAHHIVRAGSRGCRQADAGPAWLATDPNRRGRNRQAGRRAACRRSPSEAERASPFGYRAAKKQAAKLAAAILPGWPGEEPLYERANSTRGLFMRPPKKRLSPRVSHTGGLKLEMDLSFQKDNQSNLTID